MKNQPITITLREILQHDPCGISADEPDEGFNLLRRNTGAKLDDPITLKQILDSNGFEDAIWCLRVLPNKHDRIIRHYMVDCVEHVKHLIKDQRSLNALKVARRYADGNASVEELRAAETAALEAARAAWMAAWEAARAEEIAAWTAEIAVWTATKDAAWKAVLDSIWDAEWYAGWREERQYQTDRFIYYFCKDET